VKNGKHDTDDEQFESAVGAYGYNREKGMHAYLCKKKYHDPEIFSVQENDKKGDVKGYAEYIKERHEKTAGRVKIENIEYMRQHHAHEHEVKYP
jgi:hypothetical protein